MRVTRMYPRVAVTLTIGLVLSAGCSDGGGGVTEPAAERGVGQVLDPTAGPVTELVEVQAAEQVAEPETDGTAGGPVESSADPASDASIAAGLEQSAGSVIEADSHPPVESDAQAPVELASAIPPPPPPVLAPEAAETSETSEPPPTLIELVSFTSHKQVTTPDGRAVEGDGEESGEAIIETDEDDTVDAPSYRYPPSQRLLSGTDPSRGSSRPGYRQSRATAIEGMTITRVSDTGVWGTRNGKARHAYSKRQAWNRDGSLMLIGDKIIDADDYSIQVSYVPTGSERNWSNVDPDILYGIRYAPDPVHLVSFDVRSRQLTTLHSFDDYDHCTIGDAEGSLSHDDRRVLLVCSGGRRGTKEMVAYDIHDDRILARKATERDFNWAGFSPSGDYIVVENNASGGREELLRYDPWFRNEFKLTDDRHHGDFGIDEHGDEVYAMISWDRISYIRLRDGALVLSMASGENGNYIGHGHISCRNIDRPGWCYFSGGTAYRVGAVRLAIADNRRIGSTYGGYPVYAGVAEWEPWGFHRSTQYTYDAQPKASVNPAGTQVVVTSDWYSKGDIADYVLSYTQP